MFNAKTVFIAGHSRLPQGMAAKSVFETLTITVEIDLKYAVILEASCTLVTDLGRQFIAQLLRGYSLNDGIDGLVEIVQNYYKGKATNALIASLKDLDVQYKLLKSKELA